MERVKNVTEIDLRTMDDNENAFQNDMIKVFEYLPQ